MEKPLEITFRDIDRSESAVSVIEEKTQALGQAYEDIVSTHVIVSAPGHRHRENKSYHVTIEIHVPRRKRLVVSYEPAEKSIPKSLPLVINDAFRIMEHRLEAFEQKRHDGVRHHEGHQFEGLDQKPIAQPPRGVQPIDVKEDMCRWPIGDPREEGFVFCGQKTFGKTPYCAEHAARAYQPSKSF